MVSASNLRKFRLKEGITITELSRAARLSPKTAAKVERNLGGTSPTSRHRLVKALNELTGGEKYAFDDVFPAELGRAEPFPPPDGFLVTEAMRKNAAWVTENTEDLAPYDGQWVAICRGRIVASGNWPREATGNAADAGYAGEDILLYFVGQDDFIYAGSTSAE